MAYEESNEQSKSLMMDDLCKSDVTDVPKETLYFFADFNFQNNSFALKKWKTITVCSELKKYVLTPKIFSASAKRPRSKIEARINTLNKIKLAIVEDEKDEKKVSEKNLKAIIKKIIKCPTDYKIPLLKKATSEFYQIFIRAHYYTAVPLRVRSCFTEKSEFTDAVHFLLVCKIEDYPDFQREVITELRKYICKHVYHNNTVSKKGKLPHRFLFITNIAEILKNRNGDTAEQKQQLQNVLKGQENNPPADAKYRPYFKKMRSRLGEVLREVSIDTPSIFPSTSEYRAEKARENMKTTDLDKSNEMSESPRSRDASGHSASISSEEAPVTAARTGGRKFDKDFDAGSSVSETGGSEANRKVLRNRGNEEGDSNVPPSLRTAETTPGNDQEPIYSAVDKNDEEGIELTPLKENRVTAGTVRTPVQDDEDDKGKEELSFEEVAPGPNKGKKMPTENRAQDRRRNEDAATAEIDSTPAYKKNGDRETSQEEFTGKINEGWERKAKRTTIRNATTAGTDRNSVHDDKNIPPFAEDRPPLFEGGGSPPPPPPSPAPTPPASLLINTLGFLADLARNTAEAARNTANTVAKAANAVTEEIDNIAIPAAQRVFGGVPEGSESTEDNSSGEEVKRFGRN